MGHGTTRRPDIATLLLIAPLASVAAVIYTPALPAMMLQFGINSGQVQTTMMLFLLGYTLAQFFFGPITHRFGCKKTLYSGLAIGSAGAIACILAAIWTNYNLLLLGRFILGLGSGVGLVSSLTMTNHSYEAQSARRVISYLTFAFAVLPGFNIFVAGVLVDHFSWSSCFYYQLIYLIIVWLLALHLPEAQRECDRDALKLGHILARYRPVVADFCLWRYALIWAISTSIVYIFSTVAPIICIEQLGASPGLFGAVNLLTVAGAILGTIANLRLIRHYSSRCLLGVGLGLMLFGVLLLWLFVWFNYLGLLTLYLPMFLVYCSLGFIFSNASTLATQRSCDKATSSSLASLINMGVATVGVGFIGLVHDHVTVIVADVFLGLAVVSGVLLAIAKSRIGKIT